MKTIRNIIVILILASAAASAQNSTSPAEQWARTLQMTGNWKGDATVTLGDQAFRVTYHTSFKQVVEGNVLTMYEWFSDAALGDFKGENLIGYSPYDDQVHWFSADNFGTAHEHAGQWSDNEHLFIEHNSTQDGQPFVERIYITLKDNNQKADLRLVATLGGVTVQTVEGTLVRSNRQ